MSRLRCQGRFEESRGERLCENLLFVDIAAMKRDGQEE
jgi:hypothetical protein